MKELLEYIVKRLVKNPEQVKIEEQKDENDQSILVIRLADEDKGIIIGKQGRIINAIRTIIAVKAKKRVSIRVE